MKAVKIALASLAILGPAREIFAQAAPFLNFVVSPQSLGIGGTTAAIASGNALATVGNPAQLGMFSLENTFNATSALWTNRSYAFAYGIPYRDESLYVLAANVGFPLRFIDSGNPFKASVGIGYSNLNFSFSSIILPRSGPETDVSNSFTLGLGMDYFARVGVGYSLKFINTSNSYLPVNQPAQDLGAIVQVPLSKLILGDDERQGNINGLVPSVAINFGYVMRNFGRYVYPPWIPLPTEADLGWGVDFGIKSMVDGERLEWISFVWSEQADDHPFHEDSIVASIYGTDTTWNHPTSYQKGLGSFGIWRNLVLDRGSQSVGIRKGGQIGLCEFLYLRAGAITDASQTSYSTFGWGLRLDGLAKCLVFFKWLNPNAPVARFLLDHIDLEYDYSKAYGCIYQGKPFEDLNVVVR